MSIHKKVCLRFRAKHVLVLICWQIFGKCIFLPTRMGQKFSEKLQKTIKKQKVPALSNESAGIFGAASRNRTGTGLTPGDFKRETSKICCNPNSRISVYFPHLNNILV
ncbi:hypothetical protein [Agathobaculum sp.]|uniref:hypothetical protein n=1 Tax=Agathobaculum sp. TaxID=2048138 RepID=UPI003520B1E3